MDAQNRLLDPENEPLDDGEPDAQEPARTGTAPTPTGADAIDQREAAAAYSKVLAGQELTSRERTALRRYERDKEERPRWQFYASVPQKHWRDMSGRQTKVINEQATRYGIPFGGATVNLPAVVRALHDFLADNAGKLAKDDDAMMQGASSPALERYREERTALARMDRLEREGQLLPRDVAREALGRIASIIRGAGEALQRHFGAEAGELLFEAMDDAEREIERFFGVERQGKAIEPDREPDSELMHRQNAPGSMIVGRVDVGDVPKSG